MTNKSWVRGSAVSLAYFQSLLGPLGLYQHALYGTPRLEEGYCTDDNARAVQLLVELQHDNPSQQSGLPEMLNLCWDFLTAAQSACGLFRNFRSISGVWLDNSGSEDTQARTLRALSSVITLDYNTDRSQQAEEMLRRLLPHIESLRHCRSQAEALIALASLVPDRPSLQKTFEHIWQVYYLSWEKAKNQWPWPEATLTYGNALLVHGLLAGSQVVNIALQDLLEESARFLIRTTVQGKQFVPIGNDGWFRANSPRTIYDQQPIEAHSMLDFALAYHSLGGKIIPEEVAAPYLWFFGHNIQKVSLANPAIGSCYDGLTPTGANLNCGAESTLAYLRSEWLMQHAPSTIRQHAAHQLQQPEHLMAGVIHPT